MAATLINGTAYSWSMIEFRFSNIAGEPIMGIKSISWKRSRKLENNYGVGSEPQSRGFGNVTYTASITMDYNAQTTLQRLTSTGKLEDLGDFDLIVAHNHPDSGKTISTVLYKCRFTEDGLDANQDDTDLTMDFNLNPAGIEPVDVTTII